MINDNNSNQLTFKSGGFKQSVCFDNLNKKLKVSE